MSLIFESDQYIKTYFPETNRPIDFIFHMETPSVEGSIFIHYVTNVNDHTL